MADDTTVQRSYSFADKLTALRAADAQDQGALVPEALTSAKELVSIHDANPTTKVTLTARELMAALLKDQQMYAALHISEPTPTDPLATIVKMTGSYVVPVTWVREGSTLLNATPLQFAGIDDYTSVNWIAITLDTAGTQILFAGEVEEPETSKTQYDVFIVPERTIELVIA